MADPRKEVLADGVEIWLGDCRDVLPLIGRVDAVVTDPPYGIDYGRGGNFSASHRWGPWREKCEWDVERPDRDVFDAIRAVSKHQIIWGGNYFTDFLPPSMHWLMWDKGQRNFSLADFEMAWGSQRRAARVIEYARGKGIRDGREHPTQKPIEVMVACIQELPANAQLVADPFMGSGTTGVACIQLGRRFIGIEREPKYFDAARRRLEAELAKPRLPLDEPAPRPVQYTMLDGDAA